MTYNSVFPSFNHCHMFFETLILHDTQAVSTFMCTKEVHIQSHDMWGQTGHQWKTTRQNSFLWIVFFFFLSPSLYSYVDFMKSCSSVMQQPPSAVLWVFSLLLRFNPGLLHICLPACAFCILLHCVSIVTGRWVNESWTKWAVWDWAWVEPLHNTHAHTRAHTHTHTSAINRRHARSVCERLSVQACPWLPHIQPLGHFRGTSALCWISLLYLIIRNEREEQQYSLSSPLLTDLLQTFTSI